MKILRDAKLQSLSYYGTGGPCRLLYLPTTVEEASAAMREIRSANLPYFFLGSGTNSLVTDEPWEGAVVSLRDMKEVSRHGDRVVCGAGVDNTALAQFCLKESLAGASFMNRLPGQLGGTVRMNARCYGGEMSQIVEKVTTVAPDGGIHEWLGANVFRGYKDTTFMTNGHLVVSCVLLLKPGDATQIRAHMDYCESDRMSKHQFDFPSCGCVFKNDYSVGVPSGLLLDKVGGKVLKVGGAEVSPFHGNFVFNKGATAEEILILTIQMRDLVWKYTGVWLEYEMEILGHIPLLLKSRMAELKLPQPKLSVLQPIREEWVRGSTKHQ